MAKWLPTILIGTGIILRLRQYVFDRSLWLDEVLLARNVIERSFVGLLQPLQYDQNAPIGFLMLSKIAVLVGGNEAAALRFFPLVFGIISLFLFYRIARHFLKTPGALIALTFFSLATPMVYYSGEFKQYMGDVLATLILWYFFLVARIKHTAWLVLLGMIVLWFSHASMFVLAALGVTSLSLWYAIPFWLASFGVDYLVSLRYNLSATIIHNWQGLFLVYPWQGNTSMQMFLVSLDRMFGFFVDLDTAWLPALVLFLGYAAIGRKSIKHIVILVLPIILLLLASGFQKYPFVPRLLLFLAPSLYIAIGAGADLIRVRFGRIAIIVLSPLLLWGVVPSAVRDFVTPIKKEEFKQVLTYLRKNYQPDDVIYLYYAAESPFRFYAAKFGLDQAHAVVGIESRRDLDQYRKDVDKLKGNSRVWVVFSHIYRQSLFGEDRYILAYLDSIGRRLDYYPQVGASLYLYDLREVVKNPDIFDESEF